MNSVSLYFLAYAIILLGSLVVQHLVTKANIGKYLPAAGATMILSIIVSGTIRLIGGFSEASSSDNILEKSTDFNPFLLPFSNKTLLI